MGQGHQGRVWRRSKQAGGDDWFFMVDRRDPATGKRRQIRRSGFATRKDAQAALRDFLNESDAGRAPVGRTGQVGPWLTQVWLPNLDHIKETTRALYRTQLHAYVIPYIGAGDFADVTVEHIMAMNAALRQERGLAAKTRRNVLMMVRRAWDDAIDAGLASHNPARTVKPPAAKKPDMRTRDAEQVRWFLGSVAGDRLEALWRLAVTTGMRRGELLGLRWIDTDLDAATLSVRHQVTAFGGTMYEGDLRTDRSRRPVQLDPRTVETLRQHRRRQVEERLAYGEAWADKGLVFTREDGTPIRPAWMTHELPRLAEAVGLARLTPHGLRHTWATLALKSGVHPKVVQERRGHSTITTLDTYSHVVKGLDQDAATQVAALFEGEVGHTIGHISPDPDQGVHTGPNANPQVSALGRTGTDEE